MTKTTAKEIGDYLKWVKDIDRESPFKEDPDLFMRVLRDSELVETYTPVAHAMLLLDNVETLVASLWATGFQMGREFEQRRVEIADLVKMSKP